MKNIHERSRFKCDQCLKTLSSDAKRSQHINVIHKGEKNFKCDICDTLFGYKESLKLHMAQKHGNVHNKSQIQNNNSFC